MYKIIKNFQPYRAIDHVFGYDIKKSDKNGKFSDVFIPTRPTIPNINVHPSTSDSFTFVH